MQKSEQFIIGQSCVDALLARCRHFYHSWGALMSRSRTRARDNPDTRPGRNQRRNVNIAAWSFVVCAAGSLVTVVMGMPWTTYIARRHAPPARWSTPLFRETNVVMTLGWTCLFLAAASVVAWTPLWVQPIVGAILYSLGRISPYLAARYATRRARAMGIDLPC